MSIPLPYLLEFVGEFFGSGYRVGVAAVSSVVVCEIPAFGAVFPGMGGGGDVLSAASALAMRKGRNIEVLCVSGYVCLRGPAGG
jgi:hypothetical protein